MKQKNIDISKPFLKALREDYAPFIYACFPLIFGRILATSGSILIGNEKLEYSLGMFLAGSTFLLFLRAIKNALLPGVERNFRWYTENFAVTIPWTILWVWAWIKAFISFIEIF